MLTYGGGILRPLFQADGSLRRTFGPSRLPPAAATLFDAIVQIERFDGATDTEHLLSCYRIAEACHAVDQPELPAWSLESFTAKWAYGFDSSPRQSWLGTDDSGEVIGCYLLTLPEHDNTALARCLLRVAPRHRRSGAGTALLAHCADQARQAGRSRLIGHAYDGSPGAAFAANAGAESGITDVTRQLHIDSGLASRIKRLRQEAEPHVTGYSLVTWRGVTPADFLDQVVEVHRAMADMPMDQGVEAYAWDADRVHQTEMVSADHGVLFYSVAARHNQTGEFAALTQTCTDPGAPGWAIQQLTAVRRAYRGHRLGLLVKIGMLELLADLAPDVRRIITSNAGANAHMIAINEQLGFTVSHTSRSWDLSLAAAT